MTADDLFGWTREVELEQAADAQGLLGYFDVRFCGRAEAPADHCVELTTSPHAPPTHWGQTALLLDPLATSRTLRVSLESCRRSHHDLNFTVHHLASADGLQSSASYSISNDWSGTRWAS